MADNNTTTNLTSLDDFLNSPVRPTTGSASGTNPSTEADDPFASPVRTSSPLPDCPAAGIRSFRIEGLDREDSEDPASTSDSVPTLALTARVSSLNRFASGQAVFKRLCVEGRNSVNLYVASTPEQRGVLQYGAMMELKQMLDDKVQQDTRAQAAVVWKPSDNLLDNVRRITHAVLTSASVDKYKGEGTLQLIHDIVVRKRFDLPRNFEDDKSRSKALKGLIRPVRNSFLYECKDAVKKSIADNQDIFSLCRVILDLTSECEMSIEMCARVALWRACYEPGDKYWNTVDSAIAKCRNESANAEALNRKYTKGLNADRERYQLKGAPPKMMKQKDWQKEVEMGMTVGLHTIAEDRGVREGGRGTNDGSA